MNVCPNSVNCCALELQKETRAELMGRESIDKIALMLLAIEAEKLFALKVDA